jgi:5-methyltetrahydropteroyltriglutamate--homocysteine methyltransferase
VVNEYYKDEEEFLYAVAEVMKEEYQAIVQAGFLLQIDSPDLAMGKNVQFADQTLEEFRQIIALRVETLNHALAGISPEHVRHHICRGNGVGPHHKDVELEEAVLFSIRDRPVMEALGFYREEVLVENGGHQEVVGVFSPE